MKTYYKYRYFIYNPTSPNKTTANFQRSLLILIYFSVFLHVLLLGVHVPLKAYSQRCKMDSLFSWFPILFCQAQGAEAPFLLLNPVQLRMWSVCGPPERTGPTHKLQDPQRQVMKPVLLAEPSRAVSLPRGTCLCSPEDSMPTGAKGSPQQGCQPTTDASPQN